jgi:hypothetical protein
MKCHWMNKAPQRGGTNELVHACCLSEERWQLSRVCAWEEGVQTVSSSAVCTYRSADVCLLLVRCCPVVGPFVAGVKRKACANNCCSLPQHGAWFGVVLLRINFLF